MVIEATTKLVNEKKAIAKHWCETVAEEAITMAANNRCYTVKVNAEYGSAQQVKGEIECYLKENGYQVEWRDQGRVVEISWL